MAINYATIADIRNFGVLPSEADDATVTTYLNTASRIVDDYCGQTFDTGGNFTRTFNDVRDPLIALPFGTTAVTAVTINNGTMLDTSAYKTRTDAYGNITALQLYIPGFLDVDGFPSTGYSNLPNPIVRLGAVTGADVTVTFSLGYTSIPPLIEEATKLLTVRRIRSRNTVIPDNRIASRTTDSGTTTYQQRFGEGLDSTGDLEVDRMLDNYNVNKLQVG